MEFHIKVPPVSAMRVAMKAGALDIHSPTGCLSVRAGAGDVHVRAPLEAVASVDLDANLGDARLLGPSGNTQESRPLLVGSEVRWDEGAGSCDLRVKLQVGQIEVELE